MPLVLAMDPHPARLNVCSSVQLKCSCFYSAPSVSQGMGMCMLGVSNCLGEGVPELSRGSRTSQKAIRESLGAGSRGREQAEKKKGEGKSREL